MPSDTLPEIGSTITIQKPAFNLILDHLKEDGYLPIGPQVKNETLVYDAIEKLEDLPQGYSTVQKPGYFRLIHTGHTRYFDIIPGAHSWKQFLFPPRVELFALHKDHDEWKNVTLRPRSQAPPFARWL